MTVIIIAIVFVIVTVIVIVIVIATIILIVLIAIDLGLHACVKGVVCVHTFTIAREHTCIIHQGSVLL